jgi:DNA-binding IclR family transcriptional regulator
MSFPAQLNHIRRLTALIQRKATGTPAALAKRMDISLSTLYALLKFLREECNTPIHYDAERQSYYFSREGYFFIGFTEKKL